MQIIRKLVVSLLITTSIFASVTTTLENTNNKLTLNLINEFNVNKEDLKDISTLDKDLQVKIEEFTVEYLEYEFQDFSAKKSLSEISFNDFLASLNELSTLEDVKLDDVIEDIHEIDSKPKDTMMNVQATSLSLQTSSISLGGSISGAILNDASIKALADIKEGFEGSVVSAMSTKNAVSALSASAVMVTKRDLLSKIDTDVDDIVKVRSDQDASMKLILANELNSANSYIDNTNGNLNASKAYYTTLLNDIVALENYSQESIVGASSTMDGLSVEAKNNYLSLNSTSSANTIKDVVDALTRLVNSSNELLGQVSADVENVSLSFVPTATSLENDMQNDAVSINNYKTQTELLLAINSNDLLLTIDEKLVASQNIEQSLNNSYNLTLELKLASMARGVRADTDKMVTDIQADIKFILDALNGSVSSSDLENIQEIYDTMLVIKSNVVSIQSSLDTDIVTYETNAFNTVVKNTERSHEVEDTLNNFYVVPSTTAEFISILRPIIADLEFSIIEATDNYSESLLLVDRDIASKDIVAAREILDDMYYDTSYMEEVKKDAISRLIFLMQESMAVIMENNSVTLEQIEVAKTQNTRWTDDTNLTNAKDIYAVALKQNLEMDRNKSSSLYYQQNVADANISIAQNLIDEMINNAVDPMTELYNTAYTNLYIIENQVLANMDSELKSIKAKRDSSKSDSETIAAITKLDKANETIASVEDNIVKSDEISKNIDYEYSTLTDGTKPTKTETYITTKDILLEEINDYLVICKSRPFEINIEDMYHDVAANKTTAKEKYSELIHETQQVDMLKLINTLNPLVSSSDELISSASSAYNNVIASKKDALNDNYYLPALKFVVDIKRYSTDANTALNNINAIARNHMNSALSDSLELRNRFKTVSEINDYVARDKFAELEIIRTTMENDLPKFDPIIKESSDSIANINAVNVDEYRTKHDITSNYKNEAFKVTGDKLSIVVSETDENRLRIHQRLPHEYAVNNYSGMFVPSNSIDSFPKDDIKNNMEYSYTTSYHNPLLNDPSHSSDNGCNKSDRQKEEGECIGEFGDIPASIINYDYVGLSKSQIRAFYRGIGDSNSSGYSEKTSGKKDNNNLKWPVLTKSDYKNDYAKFLMQAQVSNGVCPHWYNEEEDVHRGNNSPIKWKFVEQRRTLHYRYAKDGKLNAGNKKISSKRAETNVIQVLWKTQNCDTPVTVASVKIDKAANDKAARSGNDKYKLKYNGKNIMDIMIDVDDKCYYDYRDANTKFAAAFLNLRVDRSTGENLKGYGAGFYFSDSCYIERRGRDGTSSSDHTKSKFNYMLYKGWDTSYRIPYYL